MSRPFLPSAVCRPRIASRAAIGLAIVAGLTGAPAAVAAPPPALTVSPAPGTPDANPQTTISLLGVTPARIRSVTVTGAVSGAHPGHLKKYSQGRGASFLLDDPLAQGEKVGVVAKVRGLATTTWSFTVARLGVTQPLLNINVNVASKLDHWVTDPGLKSPKITVNRQPASTGDPIFLTPLPSPVVHPGSANPLSIHPVGPGGPMIIDGRGRLVWFRQLTPPNVAANLMIQHYRGKRVLTWWQGGVTPSAFGIGKGIIADSSYRTVATVGTGNGYPMDIHEFRLTPDGDALATIYSPVLVHLPGTPAGKLSPVLDAIVQEIDIASGLVVWEWHALGHIPLSDSYATPQNSSNYDAYHFNSIQALAGHRLLISARDTCAVYEVDRDTGKVLWKLGGKSSTFRLGKGVRFWFQHDVNLLPDGRISMFDDQAGPPQKAPSSRGLILTLDQRRKTAMVSRQYHRLADTSAQSEGSLRIRPSGNVFVGFGSEGYFSEFTPDGKVLLDANLPQGDGSYRVLRYPWKATPRTRPVAAVRRADPTHVAVYASWNGATEVARWQILTGTAGASLQPGDTVKATGFETRIDVTGAAEAAPQRVYAVQAIDADGRVLATSVPVS